MKANTGTFMWENNMNGKNQQLMSP